MKRFALIVAFGLAVCFSAWGQAVSTSQISGTVKDPSGATVPGAEIIATKTDTGMVRTTTTGNDGSYSLPGLPVGPYKLQVALAGFSTYVQEGIVLQVSTNPVINVALAVGSINEQVTVDANAAMVETHSTGVGQVVDQQQVIELPLNGRQATDLILLSGAAAPAPAEDLNTNKNYPTTTISVAGGQANGITYIMDGGTHNDPFNNLNLPTPFPDALQEFKVETSALPARYGHHAASAVNVVTKSGTNAFHGNLFEFVRNYMFNARNFFAASRDSLKRNQFGGTLGGPIVRTKVFFFGGYQGKIERSNPPTSLSFVPTAAMRNGDFTAFASPACNAGVQKTLKAPFVNNMISPSSFSPAAVKFLNYVPVSSDPCGSIRYGIPNNNTEHQVIGKVDYALNNSQSVFGRYLYAIYDNPGYYDGKSVLTLSRVGQHNVVHSVVLSHNYVFSAKILNSVHFTYNRTFNDRVMPQYFSPSDLGIKVYSPTPGFTDLSVSGTGFSVASGGSNPGFFNSKIVQIADDFDLIRSNHQFAFGVNWIRTSDKTGFLRLTNGEVSFNGTVLGLPLADFMVGKSASFGQSGVLATNMLLDYIGLYAQDNWRVRPNLSVNFGVRWEPFLPMRSRDKMVDRFDMERFDSGQHSQVYPNAPAGLTFPGDSGYPGSSFTSDKLAQFAPRVGVIWSLGGKSVTSIRASWGMFNDVKHLFFNIGYQGIAGSVNILNPPGGFDDPYLNYPGGNPFPKAATLSQDTVFPQFSSYTTYPLHTKPPVIQQYGVSVQRQVADWLLSGAYLGNKTMHLWAGSNLNLAVYGPGATTGNTNQRRALYLRNPNDGKYFGSLSMLTDTGTANYNGMLLSAQRRMKNNLSILSNWTVSKCMTDLATTEYGAGQGPVDPQHPEYERSYCASDRRHVVNISLVARTPKFENRWLRWIAGDWQISPLMRWQSGNRTTIATGVDSALTGSSNQRALQILDDPYGDGTPNFYLNPKAFAAPPAGTYSTLRPRSILNLSSWQNDVAITRSFKFEAKTIQLRWEVFNIVNLTNLNAPTSTLNSSNFGKITTAGDPRIMQFALKFDF